MLRAALMVCALGLAGCDAGSKCDPLRLKGGMSRDEVRAVCGKPPKIEYSNSRPEKWIYGETASTYGWLEFKDGRLSDWSIYVR